MPVGASDSHVEYDYSEGLTLHIFQLSGEAETEVVDMHGEKFLHAAARREDSKVTVQLSGRCHGLKLFMHGVKAIHSANGLDGADSSDPRGILLSVADGAESVSFHIQEV